MDFGKAVRNPTKVHADLVSSGNATITKGGCHVLFPAGYTAKGLAFITADVNVVGIWVITTDFKTYGVGKSTTMMRMSPDDIQVIDIDGVDYYQLSFNAGSEVISNRFLKRDKKMIYNVMSYFYDYGKSPVWFSPVDHAELLMDSRRWNDMVVFEDQITHDIYSAHLQRSNKDTKTFFRHTLKSPADLLRTAKYIPLRDGAANKTSRLAKLSDTELNKGIRGALLDDPVRPEPLEQLYMR